MHISDLLDSDMEESSNLLDENSILSSASDASAAGPSKARAGQAKKAKKRHRVTMPKSKSRITKSTEDAPAKQATKKSTAAKRKALEEQVNGENKSRAEAGHEEATDLAKPAKLRARKVPNKPAPEHEEEMVVDQTPLVARSSHANARKDVPKVVLKPAASAKPKTTKAPPPRQDAIPETQTERALDGETDVEVSDVGPLPLPRNVFRDNSTSRHEGFRRRAGSASDTERGEPNLRRKLGDITRKFENIDLKYHNLREIGVNEANANVEKLRKQCEATTHASNELVVSLKKELAMQTPLAQESRKLKRDLQERDAEAVQLRQKAAELSSSIAAAQSEIKALQARLSASRSASVPVESASTKTPGSALKNGGQIRTVMVGSAEAAQAAKTAQMKEDLYSDLTGLIIRSVKTAEEGDTFDCIQTGRNGTLHFKLYIDQEDAKTASFEETEFLYTPLLDANRDRDMIEVMPEYLTEDITFARQNAAKFYGRVVDTLTKRRLEE